MRTISLLLPVAALLAVPARSQAPEPATAPAPVAAPAPAGKAAKPKAQVYDETADARAAVTNAVRAAKRENRRVLIQWGANWCHWCVLLANKMSTDQELRQKLLYEYDLVKIDVGQFDKNKDLAKELGAEFKAIPFLTILDADGKALIQQNTEPFETGNDNPGHDSKKLLAFLTEHQCSPLDAGAVRAAALAKAKQQGKRVFLHFGAPWCPWCHQLDNWMLESAPAALLAKDFVDLKIDTDRMTGGKEMLAAERSKAGAKDGGIPWIAFLDGDGNQLTTSDAPAGNIGFPSKDEEIAWFATMLQKARVNLKDADIDTLKSLLVAWRKASEERRAPPAAAREGGQ